MAKYEFTAGEQKIATDITRNEQGYVVTIGEKKLELLPHGQGIFAVMNDGQRSLVAAVKSKGIYYVDVDGIQFELTDAADESVNAGAGDHAGAKDKIFAPMPGKIVKIMVAVGDEVDIKQPMVIVEAMKMENQVNARAKGRVKAVNFAAGDQVDTERAIIELELAEG